MQWFYNDAVAIPEQFIGYTGFVYKITNVLTGRAYIGKKLFTKRKTKQVKGKKKKVLGESDWQTYWSSCDELKEDVQKLGTENFKREIIHLCTGKGMLNYLELREQVDRRVLESDMWYNNYIGSRIHRKHLKCIPYNKE